MIILISILYSYLALIKRILLKINSKAKYFSFKRRYYHKFRPHSIAMKGYLQNSRMVANKRHHQVDWRFTRESPSTANVFIILLSKNWQKLLTWSFFATAAKTIVRHPSTSTMNWIHPPNNFSFPLSNSWFDSSDWWIAPLSPFFFFLHLYSSSS